MLTVDPDSRIADEVARACGDDSVSHAATLADANGATTTADRCRSMWGGLDVMVYCGSAMEVWPEENDGLEALSTVVTTNVLGPMAYTNAMAPLLAKSMVASVVYLSSIDGIRGNPHVPGYSMGKAGVVVLTHMMSAQLGAEGIRVNCVAAAGLVQTGSGVPPVDRVTGDAELMLRLTPAGRLPLPGEVAAAIAFLASDDASYVNGAVLPVDGGRIASTPGTW